MSTSGNFASPPCPGPMTRAALLALRTAGSLQVGCHYVVTDGPTIGTAGHTSPTQVELHAVSGTELGLEAKVHTTFDNTAWGGLYDIDLGTVGSIVYLVDPWNNRAVDPDADSPTVHTQFPWHAGGNSLRDNLVNDSTLPGWGPAIDAGGTITDNEIRNSSVDITGRTGVTSRFERNRLSNAVVTLNTATSFFDQNNLDSGTVTHVGAGAGSFSYQNNTMLTGSFQVDATTTALVTANNNVFGGTAGGFRVKVTGKTGAGAIFSGNRAFNQSSIGLQDVLIQGSGSVSVTANALNAPSISIDGAGLTDIDNCNINTATVTKGSGVSGPLTITGCDISGGSVTAIGAGAGGSLLALCKLTDAVVTLSTTSSGLLTVRDTFATSSTYTASASGAATPVNEKGRLLGTTLDTAGFQIDTFDIVGGTKTLTATQSDRVRNALGTNLV